MKRKRKQTVRRLSSNLYHYLRPEEKFEDVEELKCQIEEDIWEGKRHFFAHDGEQARTAGERNKKAEKELTSTRMT